MERPHYRITEINPFDEVDESIIELRAAGYNNQQIAIALGYSVGTIKTYTVRIFDQIEKATGKRPKNGTSWVTPLVGDVLFERK